MAITNYEYDKSPKEIEEDFFWGTNSEEIEKELKNFKNDNTISTPINQIEEINTEVEKLQSVVEQAENMLDKGKKLTIEEHRLRAKEILQKNAQDHKVTQTKEWKAPPTSKFKVNPYIPNKKKSFLDMNKEERAIHNEKRRSLYDQATKQVAVSGFDPNFSGNSNTTIGTSVGINHSSNTKPFTPATFRPIGGINTYQGYIINPLDGTKIGITDYNSQIFLVDSPPLFEISPQELNPEEELIINIEELADELANDTLKSSDNKLEYQELLLIYKKIILKHERRKKE